MEQNEKKLQKFLCNFLLVLQISLLSNFSKSRSNDWSLTIELIINKFTFKIVSYYLIKILKVFTKGIYKNVIYLFTVEIFDRKLIF